MKSNISIDVGNILNRFNVSQCKREMPENTKINITPKVEIIHKIKLKTMFVSWFKAYVAVELYYLG